MLKIMESIRIKSDFLAKNCYFILWPDLLLSSFKTDFGERERFYSFEGSVILHSREILGFDKSAIISKKRNITFRKINIVYSELSFYLLFKITSPHFAFFHKEK